MSIFARALSGAAQGVAQVTNKWIDEELTQQRAQFMAELQRSNASAMRGDQAAFEDQRAPVRLAQEQARALAMGQTAAEVETANLSNPELNAARRTRADEDTSAATQREIDAAVKKASDPNLTRLEREAAERKLEDLQKEARIKGNEAIRVSNATRQREGGPDVMARVKQFRELMGREPSEQEKLTMAGFAAKGRDPDEGYETVKETQMMPDGSTREVTRKVPIRGGAQPQGQSADPIKAAMDAARAAQQNKPQGQPQQAARPMPAAPQEPKFKTMADGRMVDLNTGRTLSPEQAAIIEKMNRGEPTTPRERQMLKG